MCSFRCPYRKNSIRIRLGDQQGIHSVLSIPSSVLYIPHSTTIRHLHSVLELHCAETTTSASQLETYLQVAGRGSMTTDTEVDLIPIFMDSMRIILCPEVTVVGVEHALMHKTCFVHPQNVI
jgi:hypothetical protein